MEPAVDGPATGPADARPAEAGTPRLVDFPGFVKLWVATTVSDFGTPVTALAVQVLVVVSLHASATEVGVINASRWVPYLLFGLVAGVLVDRYRRRPVLVATDLARAAVLGLIPLLAAVGWLTIPVLAGFMVVFGVLSLFNDAAHQAFLPRLVAPVALTRANARLEQSASAARTAGPVVAGGLVTALGASLSVLVDAVTYLGSGLVLASIGVAEPSGRRQPSARPGWRLWPELGEGVRWVYRHPMLAPYAVSSHVWFVFNSMFSTVLVPFALRDLRIGALGLGVAYAAAGVGGVLGGAVSGWAGRRLGVGPVVVSTQVLFPVAFAVVAVSPGGAVAWGVVAAGQFLFGLAVGVGSPTSLGYRQAVTPDHLQGRMNATIRSLNWGMITVGAPVGGLLADTLGYRAAVWIAAGGVGATAVALGVSKFRRASFTDAFAVPNGTAGGT